MQCRSSIFIQKLTDEVNRWIIETHQNTQPTIDYRAIATENLRNGLQLMMLDRQSTNDQLMVIIGYKYDWMEKNVCNEYFLLIR